MDLERGCWRQDIDHDWRHSADRSGCRGFCGGIAPAGNCTSSTTTAILASGCRRPIRWAAAIRRPAYVDASRLNDNRIINGDMRIDQRNNGASGTAGGYTVDRWQFVGTQSLKGSWTRTASGLAAFPYCLNFTSSSAYALLAADAFAFFQSIESDVVSDFACGGMPQAQPVTLSFWVQSSLTGTFGGSLKSSGATRSYPFSFSIPTANTWTKIVTTIPGDTAGTWLMSGNGIGVAVYFGLGVGSGTYQRLLLECMGVRQLPTARPGSQLAVVATNAATFFLTGVKLEIGSVATPFNRQSLAKSMADCQRYYQGGHSNNYGYQNGGAGFGAFLTFTTTMRAQPTIVLSNGSIINNGGITAIQARVDGFQPSVTATARGSVAYEVDYTASAEL